MIALRAEGLAVSRLTDDRWAEAAEQKRAALERGNAATVARKNAFFKYLANRRVL